MYPGFTSKPLQKSVRSMVMIEMQGVSRPMANPLIRRYPNGTLDVRTVVFNIVNAIRKIKDASRGGYAGVNLMPAEKALLSLIMPVPDVDDKLMYVHSRLSSQEIDEIREQVLASLAEMKGYAAGRGRGDNTGRLSIDV